MLTLDFPEGVNRDIVGGKKKKKSVGGMEVERNALGKHR